MPGVLVQRLGASVYSWSFSLDNGGSVGVVWLPMKTTNSGKNHNSVTHTVYSAIDESILRDTIAYLPWSAAAEEILMAECEDCTEGDRVSEYWGIDLDQREWRVHLRKST